MGYIPLQALQKKINLDDKFHVVQKQVIIVLGTAQLILF